MPPKEDYCRNFQRGSCQYGDRCKFLHSTPQQSKLNPFGFGVQNGIPSQSNHQRQDSNPFGFGVQNNNQKRGGNDFGSKSYHFKPFENKWTRSSPSSSSSAPASKQADSQPLSANDHKCTDLEICKRIMLEDFKNENPLWKLTCYGHKRDGPCDIVGDISCEELRALAYDDAKRGLSLHSIVDRERNLVNSKLIEFQNLVKKTSDTTHRVQSSFTGASSNALNNSGGASPSVLSFSQLNSSLNTRSATTPNYTFGQTTSFQTNNQTSSMFQTSKSSINNPGSFGSQFPNQSIQSTFSFAPTGARNTSSNSNNNLFSTLSNSSQTTDVAEISMDTVNNVPTTASSFSEKSNISVKHNNLKETNVDNSIWNKAEWKWNVGEIPEEEPPAHCIF